MRHAIAEPRDARRWRGDADRPLSARGSRRFRRAAAGLKRFTRPPKLVLTSPLARAHQTAQILAAVAGWPEAVTTPLLAPRHPPARLLRLLALRRGVRLALIGHEPDLSRLLATLIVRDRQAARMELKKGAVACIAFDGPVLAGRGCLRWLLPPRVLRAAARK